MSTSTDIVLCVGHSRRKDEGASSVEGVSEWAYDSETAALSTVEPG